MKPEQLYDAIGELPEDLLVPVEVLRKKKGIVWTRWVCMAAAACLLICVIPLALPQIRGTTTESAKGDYLYSNQEGAPESAGFLEDATQGLKKEETFRAEVLKVGDGWILVKPLEGEAELRCADQIYASFAQVNDIPQIEVGDTVEILYNGMLQETYPATAVGVTGIRVVE